MAHGRRRTRAALALCALALPAGALALPPETSPRPTARTAAPEAAAPATRLASAETPAPALAPVTASFAAWREGFEERAVRHGIRREIVAEALRDVRPSERVVARDRNQAEFVKPIWDYLDGAVSDTRIVNGRKALDLHAETLDRIETRYGVEKEVVAAVWGMESAYGHFRGDTPIIESLATLAYDGRRARFFEAQLLAALEIVQSGDVAPGAMTGSWAGAMGHTQFMPTSYLEYAQDFGGDGKRDIWSDDPTDALASTAAYLARYGWTKGQPWAVEVRLPAGFDYARAGKDTKLSPVEWARAGVRATDGSPVPDYGQASILLPAGADGAAFMIFDNFKVISRYNPADAYVIGVGHLSDRLGGGGAIEAEWPRDARPLARAERRELQSRLASAGFDPGGVDGIIGPATMAAIRGYQRAVGLTPDGHASEALLTRLR